LLGDAAVVGTVVVGTVVVTVVVDVEGDAATVVDAATDVETPTVVLAAATVAVVVLLAIVESADTAVETDFAAEATPGVADGPADESELSRPYLMATPPPMISSRPAVTGIHKRRGDGGTGSWASRSAMPINCSAREPGSSAFVTHPLHGRGGVLHRGH
jgi:hypothetical protein